MKLPPNSVLDFPNSPSTSPIAFLGEEPFMEKSPPYHLYLLSES